MVVGRGHIDIEEGHEGGDLGLLAAAVHIAAHHVAGLTLEGGGVLTDEGVGNGVDQLPVLGGDGGLAVGELGQLMGLDAAVAAFAVVELDGAVGLISALK